ncbi:nuclear transport factor 2 family protein [Candidatus Thioglobus sp.]|nr:nuclear transport factor 2 family protein [Candidatus Thioglobus sp.]
MFSYKCCQRLAEDRWCKVAFTNKLRNNMGSSLKQKVTDYFHFVDTEDLEAILKLITSDCLFTVETHGIKLTGSEEISAMFIRLWSNHQWVKHDQFRWIEEASGENIAVRFRVTNKLNGGGIVNKSNCNFFTVRDGLFSEIRVYMAGENTLNKDDD